MSWLNAFFAAILVSILTAVTGGFVTAAYVVWYRVSPREGGSAYMVIIFALLSGLAGFILGLILSHVFGAPGVAGFFKGVGVSTVMMLVCAGIIALISWSLADIPPTLNGHELNLVVEVRLPAGAVRPRANDSQMQYLWFESGPIGAPARAREYAPLDLSKVTLVDGRWVVPGAVHIFTTRENRFFTLSLGKTEAYGFQLRFPGHPGPEYKQWSNWIPDATADHPADSTISYRFRIEEITSAPPAPAQDPYNSLTYDSPLSERLKYYDPFDNSSDHDRNPQILNYVQEHPAELAELIRTGDGDDFNNAMNVTVKLKTIDPAVVVAMNDVAADFARQLKQFNSMTAQQPDYDATAAHIASRFHLWTPAWELVQFRAGIDGRAPIEEIIKLARVHLENESMKSIASDGETLLGYINATRTTEK